MDMHKHQCDHCGTVWAHHDSRAGDEEAHVCPQCGEQQWYKYYGPAPATHKDYTIIYASAFSR